jgi:hypothetical protein
MGVLCDDSDNVVDGGLQKAPLHDDQDLDALGVSLFTKSSVKLTESGCVRVDAGNCASEVQ